MIEVRQTAAFSDWLSTLRDRQGRSRIAARIVRLQAGYFGDVRPVGDGVSELRLMFGPGYRVYLAQRGAEIVVLLAGGSKDSQSSDIAKAKAMLVKLRAGWAEEEDDDA